MYSEMKDQKEQKVAEEYLSSLADLNMNSKPLINMLTILAEENIEHAATIVKVVEEHIAKVPADIKLPILYLIDSIVKNVKTTYIPLFSQCIVNIFCGVFEHVSEKIRERMYTLRQTWNEVFTAQKLYTLDVKVNCMDRNWPITAKVTKSPSIHVNPNFFKKNEMEATLRVKTRELLELEKRKLELELEATKKLLEEQVNQLTKQTESVKASDNSQQNCLSAAKKANFIEMNTYQKYFNVPNQATPQNMVNMQQIFPSGMVPNQLVQQQKPKVHPVNPIMLSSIRHRDPRLARKPQQQQQQQQPQSKSLHEKDIKTKMNTKLSTSLTRADEINSTNTNASSSYRNSKKFDSRNSKQREGERSNHQTRQLESTLVKDRSKSRNEDHSDHTIGARSKSTSQGKSSGSKSRSESKSPTRARSSSTRSSNSSGSTREKERRTSNKNVFDRKKTSSYRNNNEKLTSVCPKITEESESQNESSRDKLNSPSISPSKFKDLKSKKFSSPRVLKTYSMRKHKQRASIKDNLFEITKPDKRPRLPSLSNEPQAEEEKLIVAPPPPPLEQISGKSDSEHKILVSEEAVTAHIEQDAIDFDQLLTNTTSKTLDQSKNDLRKYKVRISTVASQKENINLIIPEVVHMMVLLQAFEVPLRQLYLNCI